MINKYCKKRYIFYGHKKKTKKNVSALILSDNPKKKIVKLKNWDIFYKTFKYWYDPKYIKTY